MSFHANRPRHHASTSARSAARAAFLAFWRAVPTTPDDLTCFSARRCNYSFSEAPEQSTRPSSPSGLCRFTLAKRFVPPLPAVTRNTHNNGSVLPFGNPCTAHQALRSAVLGRQAYGCVFERQT